LLRSGRYRRRRPCSRCSARPSSPHVIAKIKIGSGGVEFETKVKETTSDISDVLDQHEKAIKTISLIQINGSLDELHSSQKTLAAEVAKTPASGAIANHLAIIAAAVPKTDEISRALQRIHC
jgi:hypothetical protein